MASPVTSRAPALTLPVKTSDVLAGLPHAQTVRLERQYGNSDFVNTVEAIGIGGPHRVLSPWELEDETGRRLINAGGYAALPFGEMYPPLVAFLQTYLTQNHSMSLPQQSVSAWRAALEANLIALLAHVAPSHADSKVFFSNSGAEAVEAAIKFVKAARPKSPYIINFTKAYHGKTAGALALTPNDEYQAPFRPLMPNVVTVPYGDAQALADTLQELNPDKVAGIILEPIQGEGGVISPPANFLPDVQKLARKHDILLVADEIQTGLGRSGHLFASVAMGLTPDIITLAKPLGGGMVPVGATIARPEIIRRMLGGVYFKRHSNTFGGGSLAMAVGLKSLEIIVEEGLVERARDYGEWGVARLKTIQAQHPHFLKEVRGCGMLFAMQFQPLVPPKLLPPAQAELAQQLSTALAIRALHMAGIHACYTLNSSRTLRLTPALNMPEGLFEEMFERIAHAAQAHPKTHRMLSRTPLRSLMGLARVAFKA